MVGDRLRVLQQAFVFRYAVILVTRNVWLPILVSMPAAAARRWIIR
jgi:hypothetical protein